MSDTPETQEAVERWRQGKINIFDEMARLERERDEARKAAARWESLFDAVERAGAEQAIRANENREWALRAERERDEAREALEHMKRERQTFYESWKKFYNPFLWAVE